MCSNNGSERSSSVFIESKTWYSYTSLVIAILALILSSTTLLVIYKTKGLLEKKCNICLTALLGSHVCIGLTSTIMFTVEFVTGVSLHNKSTYLYEVSEFTVHFLYMTAFVMVNVVTLDRLLAVKATYFYERRTTKCCKLTILFCLLPLVAWFVVQVITCFSYLYYVFVLVGILLSVWIVGANFVVYRAVKRQIRHISRTIVGSTEEDQKKEMKKLKKRKWKSAITCIIIVLSTVLFLLPIEILTICVLVFQKSFWNSTQVQAVHLMYTADIFVLLNSLKDPLLYILVNRQVKDEIVKIIFCFKKVQ